MSSYYFTETEDKNHLLTCSLKMMASLFAYTWNLVTLFYQALAETK